jgi:DNA-binding NarL/FixJ family response regulator
MQHAGARRNGGRTSIRVLVVDDHPVLRAGIVRILEGDDGIETVAEAGDLDAALERVRLLRPDVVLLGTLVSGCWTLPAIRSLTASVPAVAVIALSDQPYDARSAFAAGASGYVLKKAAPGTLIDAIRDVARGRRYLDPELGAQLLSEEAVMQTHHEVLTGHEAEVVRLLALGYTCVEIASALGKSVRTVEVWRVRIMEKLGLTSRTELVQYALARGMLDVPSAPSPGLHEREPAGSR